MPNSASPLHPEATQLTSDPAERLEYENWLSFYRVWGTMSDATISAIVQFKRVVM